MQSATPPDEATFYTSADGLKLYYREFGADQPGTPVICLPGLTRNSRDFEDLATRLAARRRVITTDFRGRGFSAHDPEWQNYNPGTYVKDVWTLLDQLGIERVIVIGTSLGGLCAMVMAAVQPGRVAGVVLNDIGPDVNPAGLERIRGYTGRVAPVRNWDEAVAQAREIYGDWLPGLSDADWQKMAWRGYREGDDGVPILDMDGDGIGTAVRNAATPTGDPWQLFDALADIPTTVLRGAMSDILTPDITEKMQQRKPDIVIAEVPQRGHAPLLDEPASLAAIDALLERVE